MVCSGGRPGNFSWSGLKHPHINQVPTPEPGPSSCVTFFNSFCTLEHHPGHPADENANDGFHFRQIKIKRQILELTSAHLTRHCKFVPWIIKTLEIYGKCFSPNKMFPCANAYAAQCQESLQAAAAENRPIFHLAKAPPPLAAPPTPPPWLQLQLQVIMQSTNNIHLLQLCGSQVPSKGLGSDP